MFKNQPRFKIYLLGLDLLFLMGSFLLALLLMPGPISYWVGQSCAVVLNNISSYFLFSLIIVLVLFFNNLYKRNIVTTRYRQFILIFKSLLIGIFLCILTLVFLNSQFLRQHGKLIFVYFFLISLTLFTLVRALSMRWVLSFLTQRHINPQRVLIVGADKPGRYVAKTLATDRYLNFHIAGFVDDYKQVDIPITDGATNLGKLPDLDRVCKELDIDEIIIAIHHAPYSRLIKIVEACLQTGCVVRIYSDLLEIVVNKLNVESYAGIPLVMLSQSTSKTVSYSGKRFLDILVSSSAIVLLSPVFGLIALCIKLSSPGPVIFKQTRIGRQGRSIDFYKFRSMHPGESSSQHKEFVQDFIKGQTPEQGSEQEEIQVFKMQDDPRIFPFGRFIRKTSLDEFPQFFNVLKGDMSLVGPRPCLPYEWEIYEPWHKNRLNCLPGCTGIWQTLGRSTVSFKEMVILDLYYVSNMSIFLDTRIILNTFPVIFLGKGGF